MRPSLPLVIATLLAPAAGHAGPWSLCPPQPALPSVDVPEPDGPLVTRAEADSMTSREGAAPGAGEAGPLTVLEGNVGIRRGGRSLGADRVELERDREVARASGNVFFTNDRYAVFGNRGRVELDTGALEIDLARYHLPGLHAQGRAERVRRDARGVSRLDGATWSTCPRGDEDWQLVGSDIRLDPNTRQGTVRNASLWFQGVPLFYSPWFRFPLGDERMSGFLAPELSRTSRSGLRVAVPWYWNAAPNFDATFTPRWLEERGTQLETEWRWLGPLGYWQLDNEHLPDDELAGMDRTFTRIRQSARAGAWSTGIDASKVSDPDYFDDLGDNLALSSQTHLRREGNLTWQGAGSRFRARVARYQTIDETIARSNRPYEQLPQLTYVQRAVAGGAELELDAEWVRFEREDSDTARRLRLVPSVTVPWEAPGWFLRPTLTLDHTQYEIDRETSTGPEAIDRTVPLASLDSGLIFDRFSRAYQQTLEPRMYLAHVPEEDQSDIPVFDSGRYGFSFGQLFRPRRFTGGDRVGDTSQVTLALTSRLLARSSGREVFRGSIGAIRYLDEREVTLPTGRPNDPLDDEVSDVMAELAWSPTRAWSSDLTLQMDPDTEKVDRGDFGVRYRGSDGAAANLGYRFSRDRTLFTNPTFDEDRQAQLDVSAAWPLSPRWRLVGRSNRALVEERNIDGLVGLEYESCCWMFRFVARQYLAEDEDDPRETEQVESLYFELVFKGLGSAGDPAGGLLERAILGYQDPTE